MDCQDRIFKRFHIRRQHAHRQRSNRHRILMDGSGKIIARPDQKLTLKPISEVDKSLSVDAPVEIERSRQSGAVRLAVHPIRITLSTPRCISVLRDDLGPASMYFP